MSHRRKLSPFAAAALAPLLGAALVGCGPIDLDIWKEHEFQVNLTEDHPGSIEEKKTIDLSEEAQFKEVASQIQSVDLKEAFLQILEIGEDNVATKVTGKVEVAAATEGAERFTLADYKDFPIAAGDEVKLELSSAGLEKLKELAFGSPHTFRTFVKGEVDGKPAHFKGKLRLHVVVRVGVGLPAGL